MKNILISIVILTLFGCSDKDTPSQKTKLTQEQFKQGHTQLIESMDKAKEELMASYTNYKSNNPSKSNTAVAEKLCEIRFVAEDIVKFLKENSEYLTTNELKSDLEIYEEFIPTYKELASNAGQKNCKRKKDYSPKF
ncbi:hypothetical protein FW754_15295 [Acinetobacter sp. 1207_04]|uniref:hypothetical protein n=1 Tax=Acinetobacter sp. 1207_04 TaxID=2604449 RepID=UPI0040583DDD